LIGERDCGNIKSNSEGIVIQRDSVRRLPRDGARFERPEDRAYDRAYETGGNCERLYPTCRHSIYYVDFWNYDRSCDRSLIASSGRPRRPAKLRNANLMGNLPGSLGKVFLAAGPFRGDFSAWFRALFRDASDWRLIKRSICFTSSLRMFQTPIKCDLVVFLLREER